MQSHKKCNSRPVPVISFSLKSLLAQVCVCVCVETCGGLQYSMVSFISSFSNRLTTGVGQSEGLNGGLLEVGVISTNRITNKTVF